METKAYLVTNNVDAPISIAVVPGRITIPALCKDYGIALPAASANNLVARLKMMYPAMTINPAPKETVKAESKPKTETAQVTPEANDAAKTETKADAKK